jgi:hypothetical protein
MFVQSKGGVVQRSCDQVVVVAPSVPREFIPTPWHERCSLNRLPQWPVEQRNRHRNAGSSGDLHRRIELTFEFNSGEFNSGGITRLRSK